MTPDKGFKIQDSRFKIWIHSAEHQKQKVQGHICTAHVELQGKGGNWSEKIVRKGAGEVSAEGEEIFRHGDTEKGRHGKGAEGESGRRGEWGARGAMQGNRLTRRRGDTGKERRGRVGETGRRP